MGGQDNMVTEKFNYDWLRVDKALGNFRKSDNNKKNKNNVRSALGPFSGSKSELAGSRESHIASDDTDRCTVQYSSAVAVFDVMLGIQQTAT